MNISKEIIIAPEVAMALLKEENISVNLDKAIAIIHLLTQLVGIEVKEGVNYENKYPLYSGKYR